MKKAVKTMLAVWIVLALVFVGLLIAGIAYGRFPFAGLNRGKWAVSQNSGDYSVVSDQSIDIQGISTLDLNFGSPEVKIIPAEGNEIRLVHKSMDTLRDSELIKLEKNGDTIRVRIPKRAQSWFVWGYHWPDQVEVYIPASYAEQLDLTLLSGDLIMHDMNFSNGNIDLSSGSMDFNNVNYTELDVNITSGDMSIQNTQADRIDIDISSGYVRADGVRCSTGKVQITSGDLQGDIDCSDLDISLSSGSVSLRNETAPDSMRVDVLSGDCTVDIPENDGFTVDYRVLSGEFRNEFGEDRDWEGRSGSSSYGNGRADRSYQVEVSSGSFTLGRR